MTGDVLRLLVEEPSILYSLPSSSNLPRVALCFSVFFLRSSGTTRDPGVIPICARAMAFTAFTALNFFGLRFLFAIGHILP
jgi:hypothetical protein